MISLKKTTLSGTRVLGNADEVLDFLDEKQINIRSLTTSPYIEPHEERVIYWDGFLSHARKVILCWCDVQNRWCELEPLMKGENVLMHVPVEVCSLAAQRNYTCEAGHK